MYSVSQSNQRNDPRKGFAILVYLTEGGDTIGRELDTYACNTCGREHAKLWRIFRKVAGRPCGHWVPFRINGKVCLPDFSVPTAVSKIPRDAEPVDSSFEWHRE